MLEPSITDTLAGGEIQRLEILERIQMGQAGIGERSRTQIKPLEFRQAGQMSEPGIGDIGAGKLKRLEFGQRGQVREPGIRESQATLNLECLERVRLAICSSP